MKLAILGASGHGKVVADVAEKNGYECTFYDDKHPNLTEIGPWKVIGNLNDLLSLNKSEISVFVAIGNNQIRKKLIQKLQASGFNLPSIVDSSASISRYATLNTASLVMPNVVVNSNAMVGMGCILNSGCVIEHDCKIGEFTHVAPNAAIAGNVSVGEGCWIGVGASVIQEVNIGRGTMIGAGSVVVNDIPQNSIAYGVPAIPKQG